MTQETSVKKDRIKLAAMEIFGTLPYDQVKVEDIAERAGVGKGTIYEYFSSKEVLFAAIVEAGFQLYFMELTAAVAPQMPAAAKIKAVFERHLVFISQHAPAARIILGERPGSRREVQEAILERYLKLADFIESLIREGVTSGEFRSLDTAVAAQAIIGMFSSLVLFILFSPQLQEEEKKRAEKMADICLRGLARPD
jgi:AcrR family transcriptional regulator